MEELKKCPFCGGEAEVVEPIKNEMVAVICNNCGASSEILESAEKAIEVWNKRA